MYKQILDLIVCPICKNSLEIEILDETELTIINGILKCIKCDKIYPIENSIPHLLSKEFNVIVGK